MSDTATAAAPAAVDQSSSAQPTTPAKVTTPKTVSPEAAREAEYQAKMREIRGESGKRDASGKFQKQEPVEGDSADDQVDAAAADAEPDTGADDGEAEAEADTAEEGEKDDADKAKAKVKKFKVNGKEVEVDLADEGKVDELIQKGLASSENFAKAAKITKQAEQFIDAIRDNPLAVLTNPKLGVDQKALRQNMEKWLYDQVRYEAAPEEERRIMDERKELERLREKDMKIERAKKAQDRAAAKDDYIKTAIPQFIQAIEAADLPATEFTLDRMTKYMRAARAKGMKHVKPSDVAPLVARDWQASLRQTFGKYEGPDLLKRLGDEFSTKVTKASVERVQPAKSRPVRDPAPKVSAKPQAPKQPQFSSAEEMRDWAMRGGK